MQFSIATISFYSIFDRLLLLRKPIQIPAESHETIFKKTFGGAVFDHITEAIP